MLLAVEPAVAQSAGTAFCDTTMAETIKNLFSVIQFDSESLLQQLAGLPLVGVFLSNWFAPRVAEEQAAMFDELDERTRKVEAGLREIDGCTTDRVDAAEAVALLDRFWTGDGHSAATLDQLTRRTPVVRGESA